MGTGYTRNDTSNNIANGNVIDAADLDGEFDAIATAFGTSGHSHDGTTAEGGAITVVGPTQEFLGDGSSFYPKSDATYDLGKSTASFNIAYVESINLGGTGVTASAAEINYTDGVTSNIQTQLGTKLPLAGGAMTGAITTNSTFDGRDVATDGTKLDTIETSAKDDQTGAEIKALYEAETNAYTDALNTKLNAIETGATADQTKADIEGLGIELPAANLTGTIAAARLSTATTQAESDDSTKIATTAYVTDKITTLIGGAPSTLNDLNELAAAINDDANYNTTLTTALGTKMPLAGGAFTGAVTTNSTFDGRDVATDGTKLDGIAAGATNVTNNNQLTNGAGYITSFTNTTYSAGAGLDLSGTTFSVESDQRGEIFTIGRDTADYINVDTTKIDFFLDGNNDMRLENDGDLHVDGNVVAYSTTTSDHRLKKDIVKIENALNKVTSLNGYTFEYIHDGKKSGGIIAQEVEKVMPSAVTEMKLPLKSDDDQEYKVVQYDQLHGLLIEAIKELKAEIDALKG